MATKDRQMQQFEYHVMATQTVASKIGFGAGAQTELDKRAKEGWRLASTHYDSHAKRHVLFFERPVVGGGD